MSSRINADGITLAQTARQFRYFREAAVNNTGLRVNGVQIWAGGQSKDSWCAEMLTVWFDMFYQGAAPLPRMQNCELIRQFARAHGWMIQAPEVDCVVLSIDPATGLAHHVALCTVAAPLTTIAGNTSADGKSINGDRVAEHPIDDDGDKEYFRVPDLST